MDKDVATGLIVFGFGMLGLLFAAIIQALNDRGILIDEMISGTITTSDLMTITILLFLIVGVMLAILRR